MVEADAPAPPRLDELPEEVVRRAVWLLDPHALARFRATSRALRADDGDDEARWEAHCVARAWAFATPTAPPLTVTAAKCAEKQFWRLIPALREFPARRAASWAEAYRRLAPLPVEKRWACEWVLAGHADDTRASWFAASRAPRAPLAGATLSVGDVIEHLTGGYVGVICGWDARTRAPLSWPSMSRARPDRLRAPHYSVLVHGGGSTYIVPDNARRLEGERCHFPIDNAELVAHFNCFVPGVGYAPNAELQRTYPRDAWTTRYGERALAVFDAAAFEMDQMDFEGGEVGGGGP